MLYVINYFQAGGNNRGSSYSSNMGWASFENELDFNFIRKTAKDLVVSSVEDGCPCVDALIVFFTVIKIENDKVIGRYIGDVKSTDILKWKTNG